MLSAKQLESLSELPSPLLTAYVSTIPEEAVSQGGTPKYLPFLKEESQSIGENLPPEEKERLLTELERIRKFLATPASHGSFVIFAGPSVWEVLHLQAQIANELSWGKPSLTQLLWLTGEHKRYGIVAIDHKEARFFEASLGEIIEEQEQAFKIDISDWKQKDLGKVTSEGMSITHGTQRDVFAKRMENQYARFCAETARRAAAFYSKKEIAALFLVGPDKLIMSVESKLPRSLRRPTVRVDQDLAGMTPSEVLKHLEPHFAAWEREHQAKLVNSVIERERGTIAGVNETLAQLQKGKIRTLVLAGDIDMVLNQCAECGSIGRAASRECPVCSGHRRPTTLREVLPDLLRKHHVTLEIVSNEAAEHLKKLGGMASWVRQPKKVTAKAGA